MEAKRNGPAGREGANKKKKTPRVAKLPLYGQKEEEEEEEEEGKDEKQPETQLLTRAAGARSKKQTFSTSISSGRW